MPLTNGIRVLVAKWQFMRRSKVTLVVHGGKTNFPLILTNEFSNSHVIPLNITSIHIIFSHLLHSSSWFN